MELVSGDLALELREIVDTFSQGWMPDSRRLVLNVGTRTSDAVLIRDFR